MYGPVDRTVLSDMEQASGLAGSPIAEIVEILEELIPESEIDYTVGVVPNSFQGLQQNTFIDTDETYLQLVDGGEDDETVPFQPLLVKARQVDVIFAIDAVRCPSSWVETIY